MAADITFTNNRKPNVEQLRTLHRLLTWHYPEFSQHAEDWARQGEPDPHIWLVIEEAIDAVNSFGPSIPVPKPEPAYRARPKTVGPLAYDKEPI